MFFRIYTHGEIASESIFILTDTFNMCHPSYESMSCPDPYNLNLGGDVIAAQQAEGRLGNSSQRSNGILGHGHSLQLEFLHELMKICFVFEPLHHGACQPPGGGTECFLNPVLGFRHIDIGDDQGAGGSPMP